ncbi:ABC transporter ATP-binding protein [Natronorubrum daqingense]|uniref:ABC-2 type transport system ATP-binding protein n=1 Tax=Natronorubrum daqingense TaxID=588898 RepID=A0A1N7FU66_9EURY|nr:ABC transporter ATP-binding protein [Natronorubrum daqingense]APX97433.1 copper ABC transporter ATP-binding protein [Natronorubrum daqingense]SIS03898.1 ABC-2 type transport system ATP-binding protein [Natronorubrum daqingense]
MAAIKTSGLTKTYGELTAVDTLDLSVEYGEVFGFLGPNGAGKSTTINMLLDFARPTAGTATVLGYDTQAQADAISPRVGVLPEGFDLYPRLSGRRHLEFAIETKAADDDPDRILERVGLSADDARRPAGGYSKGMRQRLATGMALVGDPDLLIMDEPTSGLDPHGIREMQSLVRSEAERGTTVFFSSHILEHVEAVCDRIGVLNEGRLVAVDTIDGLRESIGGGATMELTLADPVGDLPDIARSVSGISEVSATERSLECTITDPTAKATVVTELDAAGATVHDVQIEDVSLETLFTALTNGGEAGDARESPASAVATESEVAK